MSKRGGLIGCGFFARNHMNGWQDVNGAEIVAVCDIDGDKARAMARDFGDPAVFTDADAMLGTADLDFVDIATTPPSHRPLVELAASHGVATICQKPIADSYADARAMVEAAEAAGVPLIVHENFRWQNGLIQAKAAIDAGRIGSPHFARFSFRHGYDVYANQPYLADFKRFALMDVGIHLYDVLRHFMGEVERLSCETQSLKPGIAGEDAFTALLRHTSGAVSVVDCSFFSTIDPDPFPETSAWIEGDRGTVSLGTDFTLKVQGPGSHQTTDTDPPVPAWGARPWHSVQDSVIAFQSHVIDVLEGRADPQPSGADNLKTLALALASYEASETSQTIRIADWEAQQR